MKTETKTISYEDLFAPFTQGEKCPECGTETRETVRDAPGWNAGKITEIICPKCRWKKKK